jgi:hypothetical protein
MRVPIELHPEQSLRIVLTGQEHDPAWTNEGWPTGAGPAMREEATEGMEVGRSQVHGQVRNDQMRQLRGPKSAISDVIRKKVLPQLPF